MCLCYFFQLTIKNVGIGDFHVVSYEMLIKDSQTEIKNIVECLDLEEHYNRIVNSIENTSMTTKQDYFKEDKESQLSKWRKYLSTKDIENILDVLKLFEIDYYSDSVYPDMDLLKRWRGSWVPKKR